MASCIRHIVWGVGVLFCILLLDARPAQAAKHAFVLSNAAYDALSDLQNTHHDAKAYVEVFETLGYDVTQFSDLTLDETEENFERFLDRIRPGDEVVFVYSGHGWSDGGTNYLIPVDAPLRGRDRKLKRASIALKNGFNGVLDAFEAAGVALTVAIIDACRDNPFASAPGTKSAAISRGLAPVKAATGTFVIYSAGEGQQALDRLPSDPPGPQMSVFTRTFLPHLKRGLSLERTISMAQVETAALARDAGGHLQHPAYYDQTLGDTCLTGRCKTEGPSNTVSDVDQCGQMYNEAKLLNSCPVFSAYLAACPAHPLAPIAKALMAEKPCGSTGETARRQKADKEDATSSPDEGRVFATSNLSMRGLFREPNKGEAVKFISGKFNVTEAGVTGWYALEDRRGFILLTRKEQQKLQIAVSTPAKKVPTLAGSDGPYAWKRLSVPMGPIRSAPRESAPVLRYSGGEMLLGGHAGGGWYALRNEVGAYVRIPD